MGMPPNQGQSGPEYPGYPTQGQQPGYPPPGAGYPPPPGYGPQGPQGQGYPQMQPPTPPRASRWGASSVGIDPAVGAGLSYLVPVLGLIFFLMEKSNRFLRFHAAQAFLLQVVSFIIWIPVSILVTVLSTPAYTVDPTTGAVSYSGAAAGLGCIGCLTPLLGLAIFVVWVIGLINAFQGKYFKMPIIGGIAENMAGGPPQPLF